MYPSPVLIFVITSLILSDVTVASSFTPNCTLPPEHTNYVSGPNVRSIFSISWNCLSIIILCTWNILHLNVPARRPTVSNTLQKLWWAVLASKKKAKWMIISILMPEVLVAKAWDEYSAARDSSKDELALLAKDDGTEWELIHSYFANMGGFVLDFTEILDQWSPEKTPINASALSRLADELRLENLDSFDSDDEINLQRMSHKMWALTSPQILEARRLGLIQKLPQVSGRTLESFNKGDILVKLLALVQVSWLIIQLIARKIASLPSSQLEIATLAFSASSILTYLLYWSRPQGVETVWTIKASRLPTKQEMKFLVLAGPDTSNKKLDESNVDDDYDLLSIPNDACSKGTTFFNGAIIGGTAFGGLHCLAWNFHFPTPAEASIWRICSIVTTVVVPIYFPVILSIAWLQNYIIVRARDIWISIFFFGLTSMYFLARLFLIVETFRTLFFLPPEAFIETWSGDFPHWG